MIDECITIDSSEEDDVQIMETTAFPGKRRSLDVEKRRVPLKAVETGKSVFTVLLKTCSEADPSNDMNLVVKKMWKRFHQADPSYTSSSNFIEFVKKLVKRVSSEPYSQLKAVSDELKLHTVKVKELPVQLGDSCAPTPSNNLSERDKKTFKNIKMLEKIIAKLHKKIATLENQEVDLNDSGDDENSAYIQVCRYKSRICDVFKKICELRKTTPFDDCIRGNIKFSGTKISAVNRAIEKFYNDRREFPDFRDVLLIVEKANKIKNLNLLPAECQEIAIKAFKELGETLKRQRQFEFHDNLTSYLGDDTCDPASDNPLLEEKLEENQKLYGNRIDEVIDKYALKQTEEHLEPEDVPDDEVSESDDVGDEEEEVNDVSSIGEERSNDGASSVGENDVSCLNDIDELAAFKSCDVRVVLPDLQQMPEWQKYQSDIRHFNCKNGNAAMCSPVPGCSKDTTDFCVSCSEKELSRTGEKRRRIELSDERSDEGEVLSKKTKNTLSAATSSCNLTSVKYSVSDFESKDESSESCEIAKPCVFVDTEAINTGGDAEEAPFAKNSDVDEEKNDSTCNQKLLTQTESNSVTHRDPLACMKNSLISSEKTVVENRFKSLNRNGIKIVNVSSKKVDRNEPRVGKNCREARNLLKSRTNDRTDAPRTSAVSKHSEVIDLEKISNTNNSISSSVLKFVNNNVPKNFTDPSSLTQSKTNAHLDLQSRSNQSSHIDLLDRLKTRDNFPHWQRHSPGKHKFLASSTPKPNVNHYRPNLRFSSPSYSPLHSQRNVFGPRMSNVGGIERSANVSQQRLFRPPFVPNRNMSANTSNRGMPLGTHAALAKRTMQTTQKFVKGNNVITQTMTVVQESLVQLQSSTSTGGSLFNESNNHKHNNNNNNNNNKKNIKNSGGCLSSSNNFSFLSHSGGANVRTCMPNAARHSVSRQHSQQPRSERLADGKKNSCNDVITLD